MTDEHPRVFDPKEGCPFTDCRYHYRCVAFYNGVREYIPSVELIAGVDATHKGGVGGGHSVGFVRCLSFEKRVDKGE